MGSRDYILLDVFTDKPFGGNPLAVFADGDGLSDGQMQRIAQELNLSETSFIQRARDEGSDCSVRIFTPRFEIPMAGHPTIGTASAVLSHRLLLPRHGDHLVFDLGVGPTRVDYVLGESGPEGLMMHQPMPRFQETLEAVAVAKALSLTDQDLEPGLPVQVVSCGVPIILVPLRSLEAVGRASLKPDLLDEACPDVESREVFVFSLETADPDATVHGRMFAPRFGIPEDPATGGAHGPLGSYLVRYGLADGRDILSEQGFEMGRPSHLKVGIDRSDDEIVRVRVGGDCVEVGHGTMRLPEP